MWYVNFLALFGIMLYYVGFILTMWYVNKKTCYYFYIETNSFILTMWYVNVIRDATKWLGDLAFYINYVVCKYDY